MEAPQWPGSRRGFFLFSTKPTSRSSQQATAGKPMTGLTATKKMMADKRQSNSESPMKASFFPKSKIQQATRRRHHIKHLSSPNRPIENKEK